MRYRMLIVLVLVVVGVGMLAGCSSEPTATPSATEQAAAQATAVEEIKPIIQLGRTSWQLESFGNPEDNLGALPGVQSTLNFFISRYAGYGGCNWYLGVYEVDGSNLRLFTPAQTQTLCPDQDVNDQNASFMSALANITEYEFEGEKLVGYTVNHQRLMTLVPAELVLLEGTTWQLTFIYDGKFWAPLILDTEITAQFDGDQLSGSASCNDYTATVARGEDTLTIGELTTGEETCTEPRGIMEQEQRYLTALGSAATYVHIGNILAMYDAEGEPLLAFGARLETR